VTLNFEGSLMFLKQTMARPKSLFAPHFGPTTRPMRPRSRSAQARASLRSLGKHRFSNPLRQGRGFLTRTRLTDLAPSSQTEGQWRYVNLVSTGWKDSGSRQDRRVRYKGGRSELESDSCRKIRPVTARAAVTWVSSRKTCRKIVQTCLLL